MEFQHISCTLALVHRTIGIAIMTGLLKCVRSKPTEEAVHLEEHAKHVGGLQKF